MAEADDHDEGLALAAREQAERLARAMEVRWETPAPPLMAVEVAASAAGRPAVAPMFTARSEPATALPEIEAAEPALPQPPAAAPSPALAPPPAPASREELLAAMLESIRTGGDPALAKAMAAAALAIFEPARALDAADLDLLSPAQREQVARFHQFAAALGQQMAAGHGELDRQALAERIDRLLGEEPIHIRQVQLCRRVSGYGVYEALESSSFLAGREQPAIVYVELEHFHSLERPEGQFEVRLAQEVVLYNDADGLAVWQQPAVEITDLSRNRRRDFFIGQPVRLPARLTVGKYRLKVRVRDLQGGSLAEFTLPLQVVADTALVRP